MCDVRRWPRSRRHPHFDGEALAVELSPHGIGYAHLAALGGRREPHPGSENDGWEEEAFRGYADHVRTPEFAAGVARLEELAASRPTAVMCAEGPWEGCHRRLLADVLVLRGAHVVHLLPEGGTTEHALTGFAVRGEDGLPRYPAPQLRLSDDGR